MKTATRIMLIACCIMLAGSAQARKLHVGILGSPHFADMSLKNSSGNDVTTSSRTLFGAGAFVELALNELVSLNMEAMYLQKGGKQLADPNIDITMAFVEIPVSAKLSFGEKLRPYVKAGPSVGFLLSSEAEGTPASPGPQPSANTYTADLNPVLDSIDVGIGVGAGASYELGKARIFVEGRYTFGIVDLWKGGTITWESGDDSFTVDSAAEAELSTRGIIAAVGVMFPL